MNIQKVIISQSNRVLTQLVSQIAKELPSVICNVKEQIVHNTPIVCASFLKSSEADTVDLCVEIQTGTKYMTVSADLVVGGSGKILSEMTAVMIRKNTEIEGAMRVLEEYVQNQIDTIAAELN